MYQFVVRNKRKAERRFRRLTQMKEKKLAFINVNLRSIKREIVFPSSLLVEKTEWAALTPALLTLPAIILWLVSLPRINIGGMNDLGLISVLPVSFFAALLLLTVSFTWTLHRGQWDNRVHLLQIVVLILFLFGTTAVVEEVPRFVTAWTHLGFVDYIGRTGGTATWLDARFSWPIFFSLVAFVTEAAGLENGIPLLAWAHVFFNLLYLGPLRLIYSAVSDDARLVWLGLWFFYIANWIGQDYFSPQGFNYFFYLVILGILLRWFPVASDETGVLGTTKKIIARLLRTRGRQLNRLVDWLSPTDVADAQSQPQQRVGLVLIIVILFAVIASSHQLTPFALLGGVGALVLFDRCSLRSLPILMAVLIGGWISYMTVDFLSGHIRSLVGDVGQVSGVVNANVSSRFQGSPEHAVALFSKIVMALGVWGIAFLGGARRLWNGRRDVAIALLAVMPFSLLALQSYGGEMMLRVYLFALPWMVFFVAALFFPRPEAGQSRRTSLFICLASLLLLGGFLITRYGNERMDYITAGDVAAVRHLHNIASPDSLLVAVTSNLPWRFQNVDKFDYEANAIKADSTIEDIAALMADSAYKETYLILTHSQQAQAELFMGWEPGSWEHLEVALQASEKFNLIYRNNGDAKIFVLADAGREAEAP